MSKQTAVEWLVEKIQQAKPSFKFDALIRQAKEMEKSQIVDAYKNGKWECDKIVMSDKFYGKQYYNETYGGDND